MFRTAHAAALATVLAGVLLATTDPTLAAQSTVPPAFNVYEKDLSDLQLALKEGTVTSRQLVEQYLSRIAAYDQQGPAINAFIALNPNALAEADVLDAERKAGRLRGPLHGIPLAIKDNFLTTGLQTTAGTLALEGFVPTDDAFQVRRLREKGVIVLGKTNLHELAAGITSVSSAGGQTRNPYNLSHNPGGSSGGTAAAVTSSMAPAGLGTDTCGSIRIPAAHNNLFGIRPTFGLSSREGIVPLSHSQDVGGPIARTTADLGLLLDATAGYDAADPVTEEGRERVPASYMEFMGDSSLIDVHIGVLTPLMGAAEADAEVRRVVTGAIDTLEGMGAGVSPVAIADFDDLMRDTSTIVHEFKFDLMDFLGQRRAPVHSLDEILRWGLYRTELDATLRGRNAVAARETDAYKATRDKRETARKFILDTMEAQGLTVLAYPTIRRTAARIGENQDGTNCQLSATTGLPAISMPAGFTPDGLPVGLELMGLPFSEGTLLRISYAYERFAQPRRPPASTPPLTR